MTKDTPGGFASKMLPSRAESLEAQLGGILGKVPCQQMASLRAKYVTVFSVQKLPLPACLPPKATACMFAWVETLPAPHASTCGTEGQEHSDSVRLMCAFIHVCLGSGGPGVHVHSCIYSAAGTKNARWGWI